MKKILVVDDKLNVQKTLQIGLTRKGYMVDVADDAIKALDKVAENHYDAMLSDVRMPYINGCVLASKVAESHPGIRIVLMSAYDFKEYEQKYQDLEQFPKLSKPFDLKELLRIFDGWFQDEGTESEFTKMSLSHA
jgi:DNA-binding NtrC family response regulator